MSKIRFGKRIDLDLILPTLATLLLLITFIQVTQGLIRLYRHPAASDTTISPQQGVFNEALEKLASLKFEPED